MFSTVTLLVVLGSLSAVVGTGRQQALGCEGSHLSLSCPAGQTLRILRANYGRLSGSVCQGAGQGAGAGRCIQPTSLRTLTGLCGGRGRCQVEVDSKQFGDPCPGTSKYLELVYTCETVARPAKQKDSAIPPWLLSIDAMKEVMTRKTVEKKEDVAVKTTAASTTSTTAPPPIRLSADYIRRPSKEFLEYIKQMEERKSLQRIKQYLNNPKHEITHSGGEAANQTVLLAVLLSTVLTAFVIASVVLVIVIRKRRAGQEDTESSDVESTASTYLQSEQYSSTGSQYSTVAAPSLVLGRDGKLYQVLPTIPALSQHTKPGQENTYEEVDKIYVVKY